MPVLKVKKNGVWENVAGGGSSNGGDADTLDGKHAEEFAVASDVEELKTKVGDTSVSEQITTATENKLVPTCTIDDNGKFLRVVNGVATWVEVPNAEGVSF